MNFQQAFSSALSKGITFEGRATRSEFWWVYPVYAIALIVSGRFVSHFHSWLPLVAYVIVAMIVFLYAISLMARRLHDRNMSALWLLLLFIPSFGILILLFLCALPGTRGSNDYGSDPTGRYYDYNPYASSYTKYDNQFDQHNANGFNQDRGSGNQWQGRNNQDHDGYGQSRGGYEQSGFNRGNSGFNPFGQQSENDQLNEEFKRKIRGSFHDDNK